MTDIIFDTMVIPNFLQCRRSIISKINNKCDHIYIAKCILKELRAKHRHLINIWKELTKKLKNKLHIINADKLLNSLPRIIKIALSECNASICDKQIASLAYNRRIKSNNQVLLVSNDYCFIVYKSLFEEYEINILKFDEFFIHYNCLKIS